MTAEARVTARQRTILFAIVERYIDSGEPVGSALITASLTAELGGVSPATVRNEMASLTEACLLEQPHTSAGRIPTANGLRLYVEALGTRRSPAGLPNAVGAAGAALRTAWGGGRDTTRSLSQQTRDEIDARFADVAGTQAVLERTSHVLATLSSGVGVAISAMPGSDQLEHVHFSRLAPFRVLAVVVTRGGTVRDRVLAVDPDLTLGELEVAARFLNENFRGWELERVRAELRGRLERERLEYQRLLNSVEQLWAKAVPATAEAPEAPSIFVEGVANLIGVHPMGGADARERLRVMLLALETKQRLVALLNAYIDARQESVRVIFDLEEQAPEMAGLVLVAAPARLAGEGARVGTVAVIGPKRMQYERTMDAVGYVAQVLERQGFHG